MRPLLLPNVMCFLDIVETLRAASKTKKKNISDVCLKLGKHRW